MGVKGLYSYLKAYRHDIYLTSYDEAPTKSLRIAVDAMSLLYKYKASYKDIYPMLTALKAEGHKLLFVFDGKPPAEKEPEVKERREARKEATAQATALKDYLATTDVGAMEKREREILEFSVARLEYQGWHMTREIRKEVQAKLTELGIPFVKATGEADAVIMDLIGAGKLDIVISTDMDFLLAGAPYVWIPFRKGGDGFEEIVLEEVLEGEEMSLGGLKDAGILCGVEPMRGHAAVQPQTAFSWLRYYRSIEGLFESSVEEPVLTALAADGGALLQQARQHFTAQEPWHARIRPDHYEIVKSFLESL